MPWLADDPFLRVCACLSLTELVVCYKPAVRRGFVVLPCLFPRCLALEGLSRLEVVSVSWDAHPREPVWDAEGFGMLFWRRLDSPLSHCLSLHWFRSHVVVSGVRPQLGQAAVLCVLCVSVAALSHPCAGAERSEVAVLTHLVVHGLGRCAEHYFHFVPDFVGFCGSRYQAIGVPRFTTFKCSFLFSEFLLLWPVRD
ncbi:hypothetical protein Taro_055968, partial [Colocasia esculenta]|nr:hypothetical protein [Colocasia esculenta]